MPHFTIGRVPDAIGERPPVEVSALLYADVFHGPSCRGDYSWLQLRRSAVSDPIRSRGAIHKERSMKTLMIIFAMSGNFYNDVLAIISIVGTFMMLIGSVTGTSLRRLVGIGEWSLAAVFFGVLFQIAMLVMDLASEKIGFLIPMWPVVVNLLFGMSCLFLVGYWWVRRNQINKTK
jgi:hypothetical protein